MKLVYRIPVLLLLFLLSCKVQLVAPYDPALEEGIIQFKRELNTFLITMGELAGREEGRYENNVETYAGLTTDIGILQDRAALMSAGGCRVTGKQLDKINEFLDRKLESYPETDSLMAKSGIQGVKQKLSTEGEGNSYGCTERLLNDVAAQLEIIRKTHQIKACKDENGAWITCLRPAAAKDALDLANISIDAVWIVEQAKKE